MNAKKNEHVATKKGMCEGGISNFIPVIGGIIIACLIVAALFGLYRIIIKPVDSTGEQIEGMNSIATEEKYTLYDGKSNISGNTVLSNIRNWQTDTICIKVVTKKNTSGMFFNFSTYDTTNGLDDSNQLTPTANAKLLADAQKKSHKNYINPNAQFTCEVVRDSNSTIIAVVFTQN